MPEIRPILRTDVVTAAQRTTVAELASLMDDENVGSVVITERDRPVGIVTDRDIVTAVVSRGFDPAELTAMDVMTENVVTVDADAGIFEVIRRMDEHDVRRMPALSTEGTLAGIVTLDDFVVLLGRELRTLGRVIEAESPPYEPPER